MRGLFTLPLVALGRVVPRLARCETGLCSCAASKTMVATAISANAGRTDAGNGNWRWAIVPIQTTGCARSACCSVNLIAVERAFQRGHDGRMRWVAMVCVHPHGNLPNGKDSAKNQGCNRSDQRSHQRARSLNERSGFETVRPKTFAPLYDG